MKFPTLMLIVATSIMAGPFAAAVESLDPSQATPGRSGVCITELDGGERVEIPLTVLGTVGSGSPDGDIILVRLDHPRMRETGIIAGMSGSPVYLDGKLLGALAYGWPFASEPIGGVTPFSRMLDVEDPRSSGGAARPQLADILTAAGDGRLGRLVLDWLVPAGGDGARPLPLVVSGWNAPADGSWLAEGGRRMGWISASGAGAAGNGMASDLAPGSMVAVVLVDGDVTLAAGGTVTEVREDRLWAFGHASFAAGTTAMPLARAQVVAVLPSLMSSFKFFSVGSPVGAIIADRRDGVVGRIGAEAPMVPVSVTVDDHHYSFRAVRHPVLMPLLAGYLTYASHAVSGRALGEQTVRTRVSVHYPNLDPATVSATFAGTDAPAEASAFASALVGYLEASPFKGPEIESLEIELVTIEHLESATIVDVVPRRRVVHPGEQLGVRFRLRPHRGADLVRTVTVKVPEDIDEGRIDLVGADGAAWTVYDLQMRPMRPASFADEVRLVNSIEPSTTILAVLERQDVGMVVSGGTISAPPSIVMQLQAALGPNLETVAYSVFARSGLEMPFPVTGAQRIPLTVRAGSRESETR